MKKLFFILITFTIFAIPLKNDKNFNPRAIKKGVKIEVVPYLATERTSNIRYRVYNSSGSVIENMDVEIIFLDNSDKILTSHTINLIGDKDKLGSGRERSFPSKNRYKIYNVTDINKIYKIKLKMNNLILRK